MDGEMPMASQPKGEPTTHRPRGSNGNLSTTLLGMCVWFCVAVERLLPEGVGEVRISAAPKKYVCQFS